MLIDNEDESLSEFDAESLKQQEATAPEILDPAKEVIHAGFEYEPVVYTPFVTVPALPETFPVTSPVKLPVNVVAVTADTLSGASANDA